MKNAAKPKSPPADPLPDPPPTTNRGWYLWWGAGALGGAGLFAGSALVALQHTLTGLELRLFHYINTWPDGLRNLFLAATVAPESLWIAVGAVVITFLLKIYRATWELAIATIGGYAIAYAGKELIDRARPTDLITNATVRVHETGMGFPSGHTMIITVVAGVLWPYLPRGWRWLLVLPIVSMGLSRIYLGVHAPLDVVGGFATGLLVVSVMRVLPRAWRRWLRFY